MPMDMEAIAGVVAPVDERAVEAEVTAYVTGHTNAMVAAPWSIESLGQAEWAMRRLAQVRAAEQEYRDEVAMWEAATERVAKAGDWFEERLKEWGLANRTDARKTLLTAHGSVATRKAEPKLMISDQATALAWAKQHCPDAVKVTEEVQISKVTGLHVGECIVGFVSTDKATGEVERITVEPRPLTDERVAEVQAKLGDGYHVDVLTELFAVDDNGNLPAGFIVKPGSVTATVNPLGL